MSEMSWKVGLVLKSLVTSTILTLLCGFLGRFIEEWDYSASGNGGGASFMQIAIFLWAIPVCFVFNPAVYYFWMRVRRRLHCRYFSNGLYNVCFTVVFWFVTQLMLDFSDIVGLISSKTAAEAIHAAKEFALIGAITGMFAGAFLFQASVFDSAIGSHEERPRPN